MKKLFLVSVLFLFSAALFAQNKYLKDPAETQNLSRKVVALFKENKISMAFDQLKPYWPIPQNEMDGLEKKTIQYLNLVEQRFGKSIGTIKVNDEKISDIALRETYLVRFENTAIRLVFTYYKNDKGWILNAFKWDDSFSEEFK